MSTGSEPDLTDLRPARLVEIVDAITSGLRDVVETHGLTEDEWRAALRFLTEVGVHEEFVLLSDVLRLSVLVDALSHPDGAGITPSNVAGPFWRPAPFLDEPATLVGEDEPGERLVLRGRVTAGDGRPIADAELDLWHCNAEGLYDVQLPEAEGPRYRGRLRTDADGRYEVRTIVPPPYEVPKDGPVGRLLAALGRHAFRPAHVHYRAEAEGYAPLTTMVFVAGDPWLGDDVIGADKAGLTVAIDRSRTPAEATFDITLARPGG
jgi:protocatechuate 3,4-dioxygenase beta subunit